MPDGIDCRMLPWDTDFFGYPVARLCAERVDAAALEAADGWCRERGVRCLYYLAQAADAGSFLAAQAAGMQWIDVRLTLRHAAPASAEAPRAAIEEATPAERAGLPDFAPHLAAVSRFGMDPRFGQAKAVELYRRWLDQEVDLALVAHAGDAVAGCITGHIDGTVGSISLLVVAPEHGGRGLGADMCRAALHRFAARGCTEVRVVTQGHNVASQRAYQRAGFLTHNVEVWFHKWFYSQEKT